MPSSFMSNQFETKIMSSFKSNEAWLQTNILHEILSLYRVMELHCIHVCLV